MKKLPRTVLAKRAHTVDLEFCMFKLEEGRTYYDDGTTLPSDYIQGGLADGWLEEAKRGRDTITVSTKNLFRP